MIDTIDTIDLLREITKTLPSVPELGDFIEHKSDDQNDKHIEYIVDEGKCHSYGLYSSPNISVARTFISKGAAFPEHSHEETEYCLIFLGSAVIRVDDKERIINAGEWISFEPKIPHWSKALEDTWFIAITIPYSKDYPDYGITE